MTIPDLISEAFRKFKIGNEEEDFAPKQGQIDVISSVITSEPEDPTIGIFPCGYGKSSCFGVLPEVYKNVSTLTYYFYS